MIIGLYSVWDRRSMLYKFPGFQRTEGQAIRSFKVAVDDDNTEIGRFPEDFELHLIGLFNDENGTLENLVQKKIVAEGLKMMEKKEYKKEE